MHVLGRILNSVVLGAVAGTIFFSTAGAAGAAQDLKVGAFVSGQSVSALNNFETLVNKHQDYFMYFTDWGSGYGVPLAEEAVARGTTPIITWNPVGKSLDSIIAGQHDEYIKLYAGYLKDVDGEVLLRPMHEMNGNWYDWSGNVGNNTPEKFNAAWRHIVDIYREVGADNVKFVWSPNNVGLPSWDATGIPLYFPGNAYIDYAAIDGYNWGATGNYPQWLSFDQVFKDAYDVVTGLTSKPIIIGETGSAELGGDKAAWITDAFDKAINNYPQLEGIVWFHTNKEANWKVDSSASSLSAYRAALASITAPAPTPVPEPTPEPTYTANVSSPTDGKLVKRNVTVSGSVGGSGSVAKTQVVIDGTVKATAYSSAIGYTWRTKEYTNGYHIVTIQGLNGSGSVVAKDSVTVKVDNKAPRGKMRRTTKSLVGSPTYSLSNAAEDENGIAKVTFSLDGKLQKQDYAAPYAWTWDTAKNYRGWHVVKVNTFDKAWNLTTETQWVWTPGTDKVGPSAKLTNPTSWELFQRYSNVWLVGQVTDPSGIAKVTFSIDGKVRNQDYSAPFAWKWNIKAERKGWHVIKMNSFDKNWNLTTVTKWVRLTW